MPHFTDSKNETWTVEVTGATIKRGLQLLKVDLGKPLEGDPPLLTRLGTDVAFLVDVVFVACLPEAEQRKIDDLAFADRLAGDALYEANAAWMEAWALFFDRLHPGWAKTIREQQRIVAAISTRIAAAAEKTGSGIVKRLEHPQTQADIDAEIDATLGRLCSGSRASPAAPTPKTARSPS